jgi:hypothetical protein
MRGVSECMGTKSEMLAKLERMRGESDVFVLRSLTAWTFQ